MTATDIAIADVHAKLWAARRTARDEAAMPQLLLWMEAETAKIRDEVRQATAARLGEYPVCEE
jgi:hypothetical protein